LLQRFKKGMISNMLITFGKAAIVAYLFHFVLIFKPLVVLGLESTFDTSVSYLFTIILVIIIYYTCKIWLLKRHLLFSRIASLKKTRPI